MIQQNVKNTYLLATTICVWLMFSFSFVVLRNIPTYEEVAGYLSLFGESGLDLIAAILSYNLAKKVVNRPSRLLFSLFFVSFIAAFIADGTYNFLLNLALFKYDNDFKTAIFELPFAVFLLFQVLAWAWLLYTNRSSDRLLSKISYLPYYIISAMILGVFLFGIQWKIEYTSVSGIFQVVDTLLEVVGFALATICLARMKSPHFKYIAIGYLLIVSSDIIIRYHVVSGLTPYLSSMELTWILGLALMVLGFFFIQKNEDEHLRLTPVNSLQSQIAIWLLILWIASISIFIIAAYIFSENINDSYPEIIRNLLSTLVPFSVLAIISSILISVKLSSPIMRLAQIISKFTGTENIEFNKINSTKNKYIFEFDKLENFVNESFDIFKQKHQMELKFANVASQVAHDIRSPLTAIENIIGSAENLSEESRNLLYSSVGRINQISNDLLKIHKDINKELEKDVDSVRREIVSHLLISLINEKQAELLSSGKSIKINIKISKNAENQFCLTNRVTFVRVISNLVNNSIQAIDKDGEIEVNLERDFQNLKLSIKDTGKGVDHETIRRIKNNVFPNKINGNGIGLKYAVKSIKEWGGWFDITSKIGCGTNFNIYLPINKRAGWLLDALYLTENTTLIIVDDDESIHRLWADRLKNSGESFNKINIMNFNSPESFKEYVSDNSLYFNSKFTVFLIDYHFRNSIVNGLQLINNLGIQSQSVLVTGQYLNEYEIDIIEKNNIDMFFKKDINNVPIHLVHKGINLVVLDDQKIITEIWAREAEKQNVNYITFNKGKELLKYVNEFSQDTKFYLDSNLGDERGEQIAKYLYDLGYTNLFLTTGYDKGRFKDMKWIKDIVGKDPVAISDITRTECL